MLDRSALYRLAFPVLALVLAAGAGVVGWIRARRRAIMAARRERERLQALHE